MGVSNLINNSSMNSNYEGLGLSEGETYTETNFNKFMEEHQMDKSSAYIDGQEAISLKGPMAVGMAQGEPSISIKLVKDKEIDSRSSMPQGRLHSESSQLQNFPLIQIQGKLDQSFSQRSLATSKAVKDPVIDEDRDKTVIKGDLKW